MGYINFDKEQLINLEYSLNRELLCANQSGCYSCSTIVGCNTRKYHGLLVCPMEHIDNDNHVLLSGLDVTISQHNADFHLAVRKYPNAYNPKGHKYLREFTIDATPRYTYRIEGVVLEVERILTDKDRIILKYTLKKAISKTILRFSPFLAFRNVHRLSKANMLVDTKYTTVKNGIKVKMYEAYLPLFMQFNKPVEYVHVPDWYYNVEYPEERNRGYEYQEDLFVPGYFETGIQVGESVYFTAGLDEINCAGIARKFASSIEKHIRYTDYVSCLRHAAQQFIRKRGKKTEIVAGFPWFGRWGRDTFIALPGLTLYNNGDTKTCKAVLDTMTAELVDGLFPNLGNNGDTACNSIDAPLWFFQTLQEYLDFTQNRKQLWKDYGETMKSILSNYRKGTHFNIKMHDNGLIWGGCTGRALTWMDAVVDGKPVTPRCGFDVEINALWYNAVMFTLDLATEFGDTAFVEAWNTLPTLIQTSFMTHFWSDARHYLADYVTYDYADFSIRPNQIFACSLRYSPLAEPEKADVLDVVRKCLLTPKGLRTLSPGNKDYKGVYVGNQQQRDAAYHQGTVWPWLSGPFCEACLRVYGAESLKLVEDIFNAFEDDMTTYGIATIPEIYDGDPPHTPRGAISQAWSVGELLHIKGLIDKYKKEERQ